LPYTPFFLCYDDPRHMTFYELFIN
jgi:hypothetical protein